MTSQWEKMECIPCVRCHQWVRIFLNAALCTIGAGVVHEQIPGEGNLSCSIYLQKEYYATVWDGVVGIQTIVQSYTVD